VHAGALQAFQVFVAQLGRAVAVEDHVDLDPGSGTFDEGLAEAVRGGSRRIAELERENRELRRANDILKAASVFFATELDGRPKR